MPDTSAQLQCGAMGSRAPVLAEVPDRRSRDDDEVESTPDRGPWGMPDTSAQLQCGAVGSRAPVWWEPFLNSPVYSGRQGTALQQIH